MATEKGALPTEEAVVRALGDFGLTVTPQQVLQIQQYMGILLAWNEKVNLTAIRDPLEILHRHFCESMFGVASVPPEACRLADVGSGGGFPGLPLKIMRPNLHLFLVESNVKKATFLAEVVRELELTDTRVLVSRYEELGEEVAPLDVICSRAVGEFGPFLAWAGSAILAAREVVLWIGGRDLDTVRALPGWKWHEPIAIPQSLRRYLLVGEKEC
jgi:16S rRNA (guanine527-N7)-methyltransferase